MMADNLADPYNRRQVVTIDVLPDDVLLTIFDFYVVRYQDLNLVDVLVDGRSTKRKIESWQLLVHVCQRWRNLVFGSPCRLDLQLQIFYVYGTPARKSLDVWPTLPLLIKGHVTEATVDNVIAELEHSDRIHQINVVFHTNSQIKLEKLWTAMQMPFPELVDLSLSFRDLPYAPVLPDSFLGGSAPRLRSLSLTSLPFWGLPKLHLSATHLVYLWLSNIPHSGYISPGVMATCLSMLTSLVSLQLEFNSPQSFPDQGHEGQRSSSPSPTRSVFTALTIFSFKGANEYLEEFVARIDTPRLYRLTAIFFNDVDFDTTELIQFVSHSPTLRAPNEAHVSFNSQNASVQLQPPQESEDEYFKVEISCREPGWQLSSLAQICTTSLPLLSMTENLFISESADRKVGWKDGIENIEWLELLLPFTAVKNLYLSEEFAPRITPALQETTEDGTTEVLSTLQNLYLEGFQSSESVEEGIERFISAQTLADHPVAVSVWDRELEWDE